MKKLTFHLCLILLIGSFNSNAQVLSNSLQKQLDKAEKSMFSTTANGDSAAFRKLSAKEYFSINADGKSANLEQTMFGVPRFKGSTTDLSEQGQRVFGNFVLRHGKAKFFFGGQLVAEVLYTTGWIYRDKRWQYVHWQGTLTGMSLPKNEMGSPNK